MNKNSKILVAGEKKIAGIAVRHRLEELGYSQIIAFDERDCPSAGTVPFADYESVSRFFAQKKPEYVLIASGPPGGILANIKYPVQFSRENLLAAANLLEAAHQRPVKKLIYLGTSCTYPRDAAQPLKPEYLMKGSMELTSRAHSTARLACMELCLAYRRQYGDPFYVAIPSDIFGPEDYFDREDAHVIAALMAKFHHAKSQKMPLVELLGSGKPIRDFIFSRDLADACLFLLENWMGDEIVNISAHEPRSIREIAGMIKEAVGFQGEIQFDGKSPDGTPAKYLDASPLFAAGWKPRVPIRDALQLTYEGYLKNLETVARE